MNRGTVAIVVCLASAFVAAASIHAFGHPARACFCLYAVWLFAAEWAGGRFGLTGRTFGELRAQGIPPLTGIARGIWWASIGLLALGLILSFS